VKHSTRLAILFVAAWTAGCASIHQADLPELSLVNLKVSDMTLFETTAEFTLRLTNATPEALVVEGGSIRIQLGGVKVGRGVIGNRLEVPALASQTITVPIYISHLALATRLRTVLETKRIGYRVEGVLFREPTLGYRRKIRTHHEGLLDFQPPEESGGLQGVPADGPAHAPLRRWRDTLVTRGALPSAVGQ
jgi:LEA14-like dessication related protein